MIYKELSSDEESFHDVDSSLNETLEPECIEDEKRLIKSRPVGRRLDELTEGLAGCKLDGSAIVFEDSDLEEVTDEGLVVGEASETALKMPNEPPPVQVDFEDENAADGDKAIEYSRTLRIELDPSEIEFWFTQIENEMFTCGIKSQWMKRCVLVKNLPAKMQADVKSLLVLKQSVAPPDIYKKVKNELLRIHAPKEEETYKKALTRVLVGLPSQLGQVLIGDICAKPVKLEGCCCSRAVWTLWNIQLPLQVRSQIADEVFNHETYMEVFKKADKVYLSTKTTEMSAGVAAIAMPSGEVPEVAAFKPKPKNKGGNQGGGGQKPPKKKPSVPEGCCDNHKKWAENAWFCLDPTKCPMKDKNKPRPEKKDKK